MGSSRIIICSIDVTGDPMMEKKRWKYSCFAFLHQISSGLQRVSGPFNIYSNSINGVIRVKFVRNKEVKLLQQMPLLNSSSLQGFIIVWKIPGFSSVRPGPVL